MAVSLSQTTLSFAGCGFLCIYHAGVCAAVKEYAPQLQRNKMAGASAGSIAAAGLICNICISQATSTILKVVTQARSRALGALHPSFNLIEVVRANLDATLPDNAHELCTGRLQISLTRECDRKNVVVSDFRSKQELIQAILCSCFIPYYCGRTPPEFRGEQYFDGGWSDNQPVIDDNTITISPFSGESDICPSDFDSASLFDFGFAGTSIRFTARNIYRMTVCLIPPSTEVCSRICRQGFEDAVRFLTRNGIVPCMRCLAVQSNLVDAYTAKITANTRTRSQHQLPSSASRRRLDAECNACIENNDVGGSTPISSLFPQIMQKTLDEALEGENRLYAYLFSFRILRWLRNLAAPVTLPFEILFIICKNITNWLAGLMTTNWVTERLQLVVDFVLKELGNQKAMYSARLSYQLAVTELDVNNTSRYWQCNEHVLNINLSADAQLELDALRRCDSLASRKRLLPSTQSSEKPLKGLAKDAAETSAEKNLEVLNHVVQYAKAHDAVLAYYYTDDVDKLRMCEIFDVRNAERRHRCHSHLEYDPPVLDSRRARYQSQLANENSDSESSPDDVFMSRRDARSSQMRAFVRSHSTRSGKTKLRRSATTSAQRRTVSSSSLRKQSTFNIGRTAATRFAAYSGVGMTPSHAAKKTSSLSSDSACIW